jgi:diadenylate cyclase
MLDLFSKLYDMSVQEKMSAAFELAIFAIGFYLILRFLHGSRGLGIMKGILSIIALLLVALVFFQDAFYLPRLKLILEGFLTAMVLGLVVVFQPEIRRGLSRLGEVGFFGKGEIVNLSPITRGIMRMARKKTGALIVIQRNTGLGSYMDGAIKINAEVSAALLESIFFPNSPLHDGAVVIQRNRIVAACVLLPLSETPNLPPDMGTRHRAALGITEESDALVIVVSEETGKIRLIHRGEALEVKDARDLETRMSDIIYEGIQEESAA